ncbi:MAG TPA: DinB family protein [Blastocatellia bacterium]|nr:DinB family protein [Blastocatellia bacterium]
MAETKHLDTVVIDFLRRRITQICPNQIRECLAELTDEQLWWRPNDESNSVGNLILHVSGSTRHYLCRAIGRFDYKRDRPAEFSERGPVPREQLLAIFNKTITQAEASFDSFDPAKLLSGTEEPDYYATLVEQMGGVAFHLAIHTGQIIYATKLLKEGSLDELWIKAHG